MPKTLVTIGADPELFLVDVNGKFISAVEKIGGTKTSPLPIGQGCAIQEDNVAVEFNIPPAANAAAFVKSCQYALDELARRVMEEGLSLSVTASKVFDEDQLQHPRAKVFGCDSDFNAWTGMQNPRPRPVDANLRSSGGHVHFGTQLPPVPLIRWCDVGMGLFSVLEDSDLRRRDLYGSAGAYRKKPYGVEYRTLSNYWLRNEALMETIFNRAQWCAEQVEEGRELSDHDGMAIQLAINTSNKAKAEQLLKQYGAMKLQ